MNPSISYRGICLIYKNAGPDRFHNIHYSVMSDSIRVIWKSKD
nr:MAG TPA: hypothetical protein [Bacteriophage sp.]